MGGFVGSLLNPVKAVKRVFGGDDDSSAKRAEEQRKQLEEQTKRTEANRAQSQRKEHGTDADLSDLPGMGDEGGGVGIDTGLTGLGGVTDDELKLQKRRPLGG